MKKTGAREYVPMQWPDWDRLSPREKLKTAAKLVIDARERSKADGLLLSENERRALQYLHWALENLGYEFSPVTVESLKWQRRV